MTTRDHHEPDRTRTPDDLRRAVHAELAALAGRLGVDTDRGTWSALQRTDDDPGATRAA